MTPLALHLRAWREHRGVSIRAMEERTGIPKGRLSEWETGQREPRMAGLERIAKALGVRAIELYGPPPKAKKPAKKGRRS
jgi:transcriptional regulator with XRE-family HTH domain